MNVLRQSTAVDILIGPFVDSTDGVTPEAALTISQADIKLSKNGQTLAQKSDVTAAAADGTDGYYNCELDATDTNTVGTLDLIVNESGALPVRHTYQVIEEATYDSIYAASATALATAAALTTVDNEIAVIDGIVDDILVDTAVIGAAGAGLTEAGGTGDHLTAVPWNAAWDAEVQSEATDALNAYDPPTKAELDTAFDLISDDGTAIFDRTTDSLQAIRDQGDAAWITGGGGAAPTAGEVADAVWDEALAGHVTAGSYGKSVADIEADATAILEDTGTTIPASLTTIDTEVGAIDTVVDAILVDTAVIGALGAGLTAIPWNAAWDAEVQSEVADALAVYDPPTAAEMDARTLLAASYATAASITALNDIAASDILTASLTEAVAAEGVSPTVQQALIMLLAVLGVYKASRSGTTITVFGADETTALMTYTVDDATTPTSVTRAS